LAKPKAKKQAKKGMPQKRRLPWFAWLAIALGIVAIVAFARTYPSSEPVNPNNSGQPTAAIIDQLSAFGHPNQEFIEEITGDLQNYGFQVDLYQGDEITVDLYRSLPKQGYKLIIFRAHSGLVQAEGQPLKTSLFTNELYSPTKYVKEQLNGELLEARVAEGYPFYFAIDSKFITESMKGHFNSTFIIVNGCSCFYLDDLAQAFISKGASSYLAWNRTVDVDYVDNATAYLVGQLCGEKVTIEEAVTNTMNVIGPDPKYKAWLKYYPPQSGDSTLKELVQLAENG
jgi:hypothetical protein